MKFLKQELDIRGYTQADLANAIGTTQVTVSRWVNGDTTRIKKVWLERIAKFLNITYEELVEMRRKELKDSK